jgi:hypothetical protein
MARPPRTLRTIAAFSCAIAAWLSTARCGGGNTNAPSVNLPPATGPVTGPTGSTGPIFGPETFVGAGDIGYGGGGAADTARLVSNISGQIFTAGDNAYPDGSADDFAKWYQPTWGLCCLGRTRPVPGNHEYQRDPNAQAYFNYFGTLASPNGLPYYSYNVGAWHIVALNSMIDVSDGGPQGSWLKTDLATTDRKCLLAIWHYPLFTSGPDGSSPQMRDFWRILYRAHAEIIVNGHEHYYERFAPQNPEGGADPAGIHEYIVGTGGAIQYPFVAIQPNSVARIDHKYGVLKFELKDGGWQSVFIDTSNTQYDFLPAQTCHAR